MLIHNSSVKLIWVTVKERIKGSKLCFAWLSLGLEFMVSLENRKRKKRTNAEDVGGLNMEDGSSHDLSHGGDLGRHQGKREEEEEGDADLAIQQQVQTACTG